MQAARWATGLMAVVGVLAQLWIQVDWIGGMSEHCDYPEECRAHWFPQVFSTAEPVWLITTAVGLMTLAIGWRLAESTATLTVTAVGVGVGFVAYLFTQTWQWRGDLDGFFRWYGPRWDTGYQLALILLTGSVILQAFALGRVVAASRATSTVSSHLAVR